MLSNPKFDKAMTFTLPHEGGFVNMKGDPGGATKYGISLPYARQVRLDKNNDGVVDEKDIQLLTVQDALERYRHDFWDATGCDNYPSPLCFAFFDSCVQHGFGNAKSFLPKDYGDWREYIDNRRVFAMRWIDRNPIDRMKFKKGFINRYNDLKKFCEIIEQENI